MRPETTWLLNSELWSNFVSKNKTKNCSQTTEKVNKDYLWTGPWEFLRNLSCPSGGWATQSKALADLQEKPVRGKSNRTFGKNSREPAEQRMPATRSALAPKHLTVCRFAQCVLDSSSWALPLTVYRWGMGLWEARWAAQWPGWDPGLLMGSGQTTLLPLPLAAPVERPLTGWGRGRASEVQKGKRAH